MPVVATKPTEVIVAPFGIEIDTPRNSDVMLNSITGQRLRGAVKARANVRMLPGMPNIPGQQLHVNPAKLTYTIIDPLHKDTDLCEQIRSVLDTSEEAMVRPKAIRGVPPIAGTLDADRMKTLCREMIWLIDTSYAIVVKGMAPGLRDIEELPGYFLLNPGSIVDNSQPAYEKDFAAWKQQMNARGI